MTFNALDHDHPDTSGWIRTASGRWFNLLDPSREQIHIPDIATALAHVNRFGGHTPVPYSVGEHSLNVAAMLERQFGDPSLTLYGLLHDATEAYLGDVVRPLKHSLPEYVAVENRLANVIGQKYGLAEMWWCDARVKAADEMALVWEMATVRDSLIRVAPSPADVALAFLTRFSNLQLLHLQRTLI